MWWVFAHLKTDQINYVEIGEVHSNPVFVQTKLIWESVYVTWGLCYDVCVSVAMCMRAVLHTQIRYHWHYVCQESERPAFEQSFVCINFLSNDFHIYKEELTCLCHQAIKQLFILIYEFDYSSHNFSLELRTHHFKNPPLWYRVSASLKAHYSRHSVS